MNWMMGKAGSLELQAVDGTAAAAKRVLELLREALSIIDTRDLPPEIGARLDHVICSVEELRS